MTASTDITVAILAGGHGSRMGGTKDQLRIGGKPVLVHLLDRLAFAGPTMLVTSPRHSRPVGVERFDQVVTDQMSDAGPLAGIAAALAASSTPLVCFLSVDMPNVGPEQVRWLETFIAEPQQSRERHGHVNMTVPPIIGALCNRRHTNESIVEPFPCVIRASASRAVTEHLATGRRSMRSLLEIPGFVALDTPVDWPASVWLNLNTPGDLAEAGATFP